MIVFILLLQLSSETSVLFDLFRLLKVLLLFDNREYSSVRSLTQWNNDWCSSNVCKLVSISLGGCVQSCSGFCRSARLASVPAVSPSGTLSLKTNKFLPQQEHWWGLLAFMQVSGRSTPLLCCSVLNRSDGLGQNCKTVCHRVLLNETWEYLLRLHCGFLYCLVFLLCLCKALWIASSALYK